MRESLSPAPCPHVPRPGPHRTGRLRAPPCIALSMHGRMDRESGGARARAAGKLTTCLLRADPVGCQWS